MGSIAKLYNRPARANLRALPFLPGWLPLRRLAKVGSDFRLQCAILAARLIRRAAPPDTAPVFSQCLNDLSIYKKHRAAVERSRDLAESPGPLRLELGGGNRSKSGWINVDLRARDGLTLDLRRPLPFADGSVEEIYSEHLLQDLSHPRELGPLLSECHRVLRASGTLTAGIPDAGRAFKAYAAGSAAFYRDKYWPTVHPSFMKCPMDELNWLIYMNGAHHQMYDEQNLRMRLEEAGFADVRRREPDATFDSPARKHQTMYLQAHKSGAPVRADVQLRHIQEIIAEITAAPEIAALSAALPPADRYALLRLALLMSGGCGNTLVVGAKTLPLLGLLRAFNAPSAGAIGVVRPGSGHAVRDDVQTCTYPPFPFADGQFSIVTTIPSADEMCTAQQLLADVGRLLTPGKHARAYVVYAAGGDGALPDALVAVHKERLPDAGSLLVLKRGGARHRNEND